MTQLEAYDYELPIDLIAQRPLAKRSDARLMVVNREKQTIEHLHVRNLPGLLSPFDCLVLNDTRVVPARLIGRRTLTGGRWQGLFLSSDNAGNWRLLGKTRGRIAPGETITLEDRQARESIRLKMLTKLENGVWAARPEVKVDALELLQRIGRVPLPHYIRGGEMVENDLQTYQTVYADKPGAVAAPTAGLHFTPELLEEIESSGTSICRVTLHVGMGTFRPIAVERLDDHQMHSEWGSISSETVDRLNECRRRKGRIISVGTTGVRVLETASSQGELKSWTGETDLFIRPPYSFRSVDALLTNFHLPRSTLLVLVRTFGGDELMKTAYREAIKEHYRFFSYGDAMLIV